MLNKEKYAEQLVELAIKGAKVAVVNGVPCSCFGLQVPCAECDLYAPKGCGTALLEWANSEYVEPTVDWSKVEVDTPILVGDTKKHLYRRHFAKYENGKVYAYDAGRTSWSCRDEQGCLGSGYTLVKWDYAELVIQPKKKLN